MVVLCPPGEAFWRELETLFPLAGMLRADLGGASVCFSGRRPSYSFVRLAPARFARRGFSEQWCIAPLRARSRASVRRAKGKPEPRGEGGTRPRAVSSLRELSLLESKTPDAIMGDSPVSIATKPTDGAVEINPKEGKGASQQKKIIDLNDPRTYQRLKQMVRRACPAWLERESEDLGQRAMMRLLELDHRAGPEKREICASYLYRTANSIVVDEIRKRKREILAEDIEDYRGDAAKIGKNQELHSKESPLGLLRSVKLREAIQHCLSRLNEERRRATSLRLQGFSNLEISNILDWKPKKAENMALRGRDDLRKCLSRKGYSIKC